MRNVCVQINMVRLGERLARTWGRPLTSAELRRWLLDQGFTNHSGSQWYCDGPKIECLQSNEIVRHVYLETEDGVTMVEPPRLTKERQDLI